jgi:hypothetical protein
MKIGRWFFGLGLCTNYIYIAGGINDGHNERTIERYNIMTDEWKLLTARIPNDSICRSNFITVKQRYLFSFSQKLQGENPSIQTVIKMDSLKLYKGLMSLDIRNPCFAVGKSYGMISLGFEENEDNIFRVLVFGGIAKTRLGSQKLDKASILRTSNNDFSTCELT